MARSRLEAAVPGRDALRWTVVYPAAVVLPIVLASFAYPLAKYALLLVGIPAGLAFGFMGEDFRAQSAEEIAYHRGVDDVVPDENPDERIGNMRYVYFTGGLGLGSLVCLALLFAFA